MADISYGRLPFNEQIAFFRRKLNMPTESWLDVWQAAHDHAFMVAGANREDLLLDFRIAVDKAIANGSTLAEFRKDFDAIVAKYGWDYNGGRNWRSRVIYETNLRTSYAAGRYAQLQKGKKWRPYWQYVHSDAVQHPRPLHLAWNGMVLDADDPWWRTHYPPNGWGCQCTVHGLNQRDLERLGKSGPDKAPNADMQQVTIGQRSPGGPREVEVPAGVDPGFGYSPGRSSWMQRHAEDALDRAQAEAGQEWVSVMQATAEQLGRPARIPAAAPPVALGQRAHNADEVTQALRDLLGEEQRVFDVHGLPVLIDAEVLGRHIDPARAEYLPLLLDALRNPFEVWIQPQHNAATGVYRVRGRIIKGYDLGKGRTMLLVVDRQDGVFTGWTFIPIKQQRYADKQRAGLLWWGEEE